MSELDILLSLAWENELDSTEGKILYEKLSKAEEDSVFLSFLKTKFNVKDNLSITTKIEQLIQNQKTPSDIEKIHNYETLFKDWSDMKDELRATIDYKLELEKEIQQLKRQLKNECDNTEKWRLENKQLKEEILHLTALLNMPENETQEEAEKLLKRCFEKNRQINKLLQDSKTNAEIVEIVKKWVINENNVFHDMFNEYCPMIHDVERIKDIEKEYHHIQSILENKPQ